MICLFPTSAPGIAESQGSAGAVRALLLTDLGCPLGSRMLLTGGQPQLAPLLPNQACRQHYWERRSLVKGNQILPLGVKEKRRGEDGEESPLRSCNPDQAVLS